MMSKNRDMYIVLADDDIDDRELFTEALVNVGLNLQLMTVNDGEGLMSLLKSGNRLPDLIFVDLNMPNKNGKECLREIRESDLYENIPVVIYSTSSSPRDIEETFEKGANLYVTKPTSFADLKRIASSVLTINWNNHKTKLSKKNFLYNTSNM